MRKVLAFLVLESALLYSGSASAQNGQVTVCNRTALPNAPVVLMTSAKISAGDAGNGPVGNVGMTTSFATEDPFEQLTSFDGLIAGSLVPIYGKTYKVVEISHRDNKWGGPGPEPIGWQDRFDCITVANNEVNLIDHRTNVSVVQLHKSLMLLHNFRYAPRMSVQQSNGAVPVVSDMGFNMFFTEYESRNHAGSVSVVWQEGPDNTWNFTGLDNPSPKLPEHRLNLRRGDRFTAPGWGEFKVADIIPEAPNHPTWLVLNFVPVR